MRPIFSPTKLVLGLGLVGCACGPRASVKPKQPESQTLATSGGARMGKYQGIFESLFLQASQPKVPKVCFRKERTCKVFSSSFEFQVLLLNPKFTVRLKQEHLQQHLLN